MFFRGTRALFLHPPDSLSSWKVWYYPHTAGLCWRWWAVPARGCSLVGLCCHPIMFGPILRPIMALNVCRLVIQCCCSNSAALDK